MDAIDRAILSVLQQDARVFYRALGQRVGLSANAAADRVRRLLRAGIVRFTAVVDPAAADAQLRMFIDVRLRPGETDEHFETTLAGLPAITEANHITGSFDYLLRADLPDASHLGWLLRELKNRAGVADTNTRVILRRTLPDG